MPDCVQLTADRESWARLLQEAGEALWPLERHEIPRGDDTAVAARAMRVRVSRLVRACGVLTECGYVSETAGLVRSIWEDAVSAAFIAKSPAARSKRWIEHADARRIYHLKRDLDTPGLMTANNVALIQDAVAGKEAATTSDWAGTSASGLAPGLASSDDEVRRLLSRDFRTYYETLCDYAHGNPFAVDQLLRSDGDGAYADVGPDGQGLDEFPGLALYGAWQFGKAVASLGADVDETGLRRLLDEAQRRIAVP